ncbi:phage tail protein [Flindersiella endophytica]
MGGARQTADSTKQEVGRALADGKRKTADGAPPRVISGPNAVLALQRYAGNQAVSALMAAKLRSPAEQQGVEIDTAIRELRRDEPAIDPVEKGLKAAQQTGVPVDLEGTKPPASALAVTKTGFGPSAVPAKQPVPPPKSVAPVSPLGKAGAKAPKPTTGGGKAAATPTGAAVAPAPAGGAAPAAPAPLAPDQLLLPPVPPTDVRPDADPAFAQVKGNLKGFAKNKKAHAPATAKAKEAQDAALAPSDDLQGQAKAAKVDTMDAQQPGTFDKKAFIAAVKAAIEAKAPKTLTEADDPKSTGQVKGDVKGLVTQGKEGQAKDIETATDAPPDTSKAVPKPVTPMGPENASPAVQIPADGAVPKPAPAEQTNLQAGKAAVNEEMTTANVTDQQLEESNEDEFKQALSDKQTAAAHADRAPAQFRQQEQQVIAQGKTEATAQTTAATAGMQATQAAALAGLVGDKGKTKSRDEAKRAEVTTKIQGIFAAAETDVKKLLDGIDPKVDAAFEQGEAAARATFESYVAAKMSAYKKDRYGGWLGGLRWAKDKLLGMPDKVNEFYEAGRELYLKQMDGVISRVADIVGNDLTAAKLRIAKGRGEIAEYVKTLPKDLQKVGSEESEKIGERFEQLESDVTAKQDATVENLASKYVEARKGLNDRIEELQAENKGLVDKAIDGIKAVINTIRELVDMLTNVLARAAAVVGDIIQAPVKFLGNLIAGVKGGILKFKDNILDHLRKGLMSWLFGALAEGGIELPETFDVKGIVKLLASIFGLTWANIRNRIVKQVGEPAMSAIEKGVEIFQIISTQGVGGLWEKLVEKVGDIKEMILEQVKEFVVTKIIVAGITWLIGLLNPAAAFIKACKLIYDIVMFFVNNGSRIMKFVNTVLDSVADIVRGNVGGVIDKINDVLGQMVPIIIGFLASAIGLGGIGQKIREIIEKLQKPVNKALDFLIKTGLKVAGPIIRGIKGIGSKVKAKVAAGKAWVKGKVDAAKTRLTGGGREQAPATQPADGAHVDLQKPLSMDGASHTLFAKTTNGKLLIEMASRREELWTLLGRAEDEATELEKANTPKKGLRKALKKVYEPLGRATTLHDSTYQGVKMTADIERRINEDVVLAAGLLADIGRDFGLKSLAHLGHASEWVTIEGELKTGYRGTSFRPKVYGSWDSNNKTGGKYRDAQFNRLRALIPAGSPELADSDAYHCPECKKIQIDKAKTAGELTLDHSPSVVNHWKTTGNNCSQVERNDWYNGKGPSGAKLDPMCRSCNSGKGGGEEDPKSYKVGRKFRGKDEGVAPP